MWVRPLGAKPTVRLAGEPALFHIINSIQIIGFVGQDPERRQAKGNAASYTVSRSHAAVLERHSGRVALEDQSGTASSTWNGLGERIAASLRKGDNVLVEGTLVSSTFEREVRRDKKNATVKQISWSIRANAVRKLNRTDKEPEAIASGSFIPLIPNCKKSRKAPRFRRVLILVPSKGDRNAVELREGTKNDPLSTVRSLAQDFPTITQHLRDVVVHLL